MLMGLSLAMMPVLLYPIFRKHNEVLALGAVLFRGAIEAISYAHGDQYAPAGDR